MNIINNFWSRGIPRTHCGSKQRRTAAVMLAVFLAPVFGSQLQAQGSPPSEYQIKAAILFNIVKFIDWPTSSFASPHSPFSICILGQDPFGNTLDDALAGKAIAERSLKVERLKDKTEARHCQMVFISSSESRNYSDIIDSLRGASILLVGETDGFATSGGIIEFAVAEEHVRFAINPDAAERAGLQVSSKLLALAKIVHSKGS
jgi:hypothetical protein